MSLNAPPTGNPYADIGIAVATVLAQNLGSRDQGLNKKQRRELEAAGWTKLGGGKGWQSPTGQTVRNRDQLRREWRALNRGPSVADRMPSSAPPPASVPYWAAVFGLPSAKRPSQADIRRVMDAVRRADIERLLRQSKLRKRLRIGKARGRELLAVVRRQAPRVAAPILKRIPKGAGPIVAAQVAYQVGWEIGSAAYRWWDRYKYGPPPAQPGAPGVPAKPRAARPKRVPKPPIAAPVITRPATGSQTSTRKRTNTQAAAAAAPKLEPVTITVPRMPAPGSPTVARAPAPTAARSTMTLPRVAQALGLIALGATSSRAGTSKSPKQVTRAQPLPLTAFNAPPLGLPPKVGTRECKCEPSRKRSGAKRCRNPVTRRTKRVRGGQTFVTITRRLEC